MSQSTVVIISILTTVCKGSFSSTAAFNRFRECRAQCCLDIACVYGDNATIPLCAPKEGPSQLIAGQKTIYWTTSRLRKLLRGVFSTARQEHFAKAVKALKAWPERTKEQNIDDASRINPRKRMDGGHYWPTSMLTLMEEYADRAPAEGIDPVKLRAVLSTLNEALAGELRRAGGFAKDTTRFSRLRVGQGY